MVRISGCLLCNTWAFHLFAQVGKSAQKMRMVVRVAVSTCRETTETPTVRLANEAGELGVFKVCGDHPGFEFTGFEHLP